MNKPKSSTRSLSSALVLVAAVAAGAGLWLGQRYFTPTAPLVMQSAVLYPDPQALPDFELKAADGTKLGSDQLKGHWNLLFFGFTHCPDVCPVTLTVLADVERRLSELGLADRLAVTFISVDPQRDDNAKLGNYATYFSKSFVAATGDDTQLQALTRALGLVYVRTPDGQGSYSVDHSTSVILIDDQARVAGLFRPPLDAGRIAADLRVLIERG